MTYSAALCSATDPTLVDETFKFVLTGAKDQDVYMFIAFLANNVATRRRMSKFFMDNYDEVSAVIYFVTDQLTYSQVYRRFSTNTQLAHLVSVSTFFERCMGSRADCGI